MAIYIDPLLVQFFEELQTHPNIPYKPWGPSLGKLVPDDLK
jgi:hypothetical protein